MIKVKDLTLYNLDDVFSICAGVASAYDVPEEGLGKGKEYRKNWLKKMLQEYGSCTKIAYIDERPVAQILYYPETAMKYMKERRKNVVHIQCIVNPFTETQKLGIGAALIESLKTDCAKGLEILGGEKCSYIVAYPYPTAIGVSFADFYTKMGFKKGENEYYFEVTSKYEPRKKSEYVPVPEDKDKVILFYNPNCEFGLFYVNNVKNILGSNFENLPIKIFNLWEDYEEYLKRPQQTVVAARAIVNQQTVDDFLIWEDVDKWLDEIRDKLEHGL